MRIRSSGKRFIKAHPPLYRLIARSSAAGYRVKAFWEGRSNERRYDAPVDPLALLTVNPNDIRVYTPDDIGTTYRLGTPLSPVAGGDWATDLRPLSEYDLFASLLDHFGHGVAWQDTPFYERVVDAVEDGSWDCKWGVTDRPSLERRCRKLDRLHASIRTDGYRRQRELRGSGSDVIEIGPRAEHLYPPELHEVTVHIDRDGRFVFHEGRHRLAIAVALGLDRIPVRVRRRHTDWQRMRDRIATGLEDPPNAPLDHPDCRDLTDTDGTRTIGAPPSRRAKAQH